MAGSCAAAAAGFCAAATEALRRKPAAELTLLPDGVRQVLGVAASSLSGLPPSSAAGRNAGICKPHASVEDARSFNLSQRHHWFACEQRYGKAVGHFAAGDVLKPRTFC